MAPIKVGGDVKQMLKDDIAAEKSAIELYKRAIKLCQELDDPTSRHIYEDILVEEEDHDYTFSSLLGK
jgi:bacterioferritin